MEPHPAPAHRRLVQQQGLLLLVSLFTFWNPPTTAQPTLELVPSEAAAEGKNVLFLLRHQTGELLGYSWYKGRTVNSNQLIASYVVLTQRITTGPAYSGRETIYPNGSLLFQNVSLEDTGYYTLQITRADLFNAEVTGELRVYPELPKPSITTNSSDPMEHKDRVVLTCEPKTENITYLWFIKGQSIQNSAKLELSKDNRTLTLLLVTKNDIGPYQCEFQNPVSANRSDPLYLNVLYGPEAPTISPSHSHYRSGENLSLSCHAASNPPAQYSWLISGRPKQSTQELFIPNITVNDSGSYTCFVHNSVTGLNRTTVKIITVSDDSTQQSPGLSEGAIAGIVIGILAGVALIAALVYFLFIRKTGGASDQRDVTEHKPSASNHSQGHSDDSPNTNNEVAYSSLNFSAQESNHQTPDSLSPTTTETIYSEVKKK